MRSSRASRGFFSRFRPPSSDDRNNDNTTATTTIRRSAGANGGGGEDTNNRDLVDEMNPLHVPLSFLPLLLVLFALSLHGGGATSTSTSNAHGGRALEGSITTSTLYGDTFAPGTTDQQKQYRARPAGFGARFDYGEVYPAHLQVIGDDVHLCGGVLHTTTTHHDDGDGSGGVYDDDEGGRGGLLGGGGTMSSSSSGRRLYNDTTTKYEHDVHVVPVLPDKDGRHIPGAYFFF